MRNKGTAVSLHWIRYELQTFKINKNKHTLHTNWCEIHCSDLWSFGLYGDQKNTLTQLAEFS